jgi:hypothetical protein
MLTYAGKKLFALVMNSKAAAKVLSLLALLVQ